MMATRKDGVVIFFVADGLENPEKGAVVFALLYFH